MPMARTAAARLDVIVQLLLCIGRMVRPSDIGSVGRRPLTGRLRWVDLQALYRGPDSFTRRNIRDQLARRHGTLAGPSDLPRGAPATPREPPMPTPHPPRP